MPEERKRPTRSALVELTIVRLKEFLREPDAVFWVFAFPLLLTLALGYAFRESAPEPVPVGIVQSAGAAEVLEALKESPALQPRVYEERMGREQLRRGRISLLVTPGAPPQYQFDPTRPEARAARLEVDEALQRARGRRDVFEAREVRITERGSRYIDFLVPGLLGMNLMGTGMWGIGFSIVNARLRKLLKRMFATPLRRTDFLAAQFLSRLVFLVLEVAIVVVFATLVFDVPMRGSFALFSTICLVGGAAFSGLGLLIASRARTIEAVSGLMNFVMLPMWICSGVFFSYERFPDAVLPVIRALPLTALNDALRAVMNEGAGIVQVAPQLAILAVWTVVSAWVGLKIFRWQ